MGLIHSLISHFNSLAKTLIVAVLPTPAGPVNKAIGGSCNVQQISQNITITSV